MPSSKQSKQLIVYGFLASFVLEIVYLLYNVLISIIGAGALYALYQIANVLLLVCTVAITAGFLCLYLHERRAADLVVGIASAIALLGSLVQITGIPTAIVNGLLFWAWALALAWRLLGSQRNWALVLACCFAVGVVARITFFALLVTAGPVAGASLASTMISLATLAAYAAAYLALRAEFFGASSPTASASAPISSGAAASLAGKAQPKKNGLNGSKSMSGKVASGSAAQLVAEAEPSIDEVRGTNGFNVWMQLVSQPDSTLHIQNNHSLLMSEQLGRPLLRDICAGQQYQELVEAIQDTARVSAGLVTKPYDVTIGTTRYEAWLLEHFERRDLYDSGKSETMSWDYCLARDGKLFVVTRTSQGDVHVNDMLPFYPNMVTDSVNMGLVLVMHGCVGALDLVPADPSLRRVYRFRGADDTIEFDFPWDEKQGGPAYTAIGLTERLNRLVGQPIWSNQQ